MTDIETLLKSADPGAETLGYTEAERRDLLARSIAPEPKRSRLGWRLAAVAAATATVIGIGASSLATPAISARAEEVLTQAAINAVDQPAEPDQYWEITEHALGGGELDDPCRESYVEKRYLSVDGNQPSWYFSDNAAPEDCQSRDEDPTPDQYAWAWSKSPNELADNWYWPSPSFLASLPRDVDQLRARMEADSEGLSDSGLGVYSLALNALDSGLAPADLRASIFEVLKTVPGLTVVDEMKLGSRSVVVFGVTFSAGFEDQQIVQQLMIDPDIGQVVGLRVVLSEDNIREATYERRLVDEIPEQVRDIATVHDCEIVVDNSLGRDQQLVCTQ